MGEDREFFIKSHLEAGFGDINLEHTICVDTTDFVKVDYKKLFSAAERFLSG